MIASLKELGYKRVRSVVVFPSESTRHIIAQGMICPTVFNYYSRFFGGTYS
jgi:hypothetical protein